MLGLSVPSPLVCCESDNEEFNLLNMLCNLQPSPDVLHISIWAVNLAVYCTGCTRASSRAVSQQKVQTGNYRR